MDDEAQRAINERLDGFATMLASIVARQRRQEDISAEHHEHIKTIIASLDATSAAVRVLMHEKYKDAK